MIRRVMSFITFEPLLTAEMMKMMKWGKSAQDKATDAWDAEKTNPALYKEMMDEFVACFKAADANGDGLLNE